MKFLFVTLFPEQIEQAASHSILQRAASKGLIEVSCINPRDFTHDVHRTVDDSPFGGGAGGGVKVTPICFLIIKDGNVRMMPVPEPANSTADRIVEMLPDTLEKLTSFLDSKKATE